MSLTSHIHELKRKHADLEHAVEAAMRAPGASDVEIKRMKKEKLRLKEEITRLSS